MLLATHLLLYGIPEKETRERKGSCWLPVSGYNAPQWQECEATDHIPSTVRNQVSVGAQQFSHSWSSTLAME